MRAAVMSDIHLGRRQFRKTKDDINIIEQAIYDQWLESIDRVIQERPDILFITGDLFDSPNPSMLAISYAIRGYSKLATTDIAVITIGGNHEFSNKNHKESSHPFSILESAFTEHTFVYKDYHVLELSEYNIVCLPHQPVKLKEDLDVNQESLTPIYARILKDIRRRPKKNILLTHGVIESWAKMYIGQEDIGDGMRVSNMIIRDEFVSNFDLTLIGHSHNHFVERVESKPLNKVTSRISPGGIFDERTAKDHGPIIIDLEKVGEQDDDSIKQIGIPNINTYRVEARNIDEMQKALLDVKEGHIYLISYLGQWKDIPSEMYEEAIRKALYLNVTDNNVSENTQQKRTIKGFWEWIASNDKEMELEFREVLKQHKNQ